MKKVTVISTSLRLGSNSPHEIAGNAKLQEAYEMGKSV